jgi:plasmid maintenance system antidote protein VapI
VRREVLIPLKLGVREAAALLRTDPSRFGQMLCGTWPLTPALACRIEAVFGLPVELMLPHAPPALLVACRWKIPHLGLARYRPAPARKRRRGSSFDAAGADRGTFGQLLGKAIGVERALFRDAARRLGIDPAELSAIIRGRRGPTQVMLRNKALLERVKTEFPAGWRRHGAALTRAASLLRPSRQRLRRLLPPGD